MYNETVSMMSKYEATKCPHCITLHIDQYSLIVASYIMNVKIINVNNLKNVNANNLPHYPMYLSSQIFHPQLNTEQPRKNSQRNTEDRRKQTRADRDSLKREADLDGEGNRDEQFVKIFCKKVKWSVKK